jgi:hypothetical protein
VELAQSVFEQVEYEIDSTPERAIVRIQAQYGDYRIFVTELFDDTTRKYRYSLVFRKFGQYQARKAGFHACESLIASYPTGKWAVTEAFLKSWSERRKPTFFKYRNKRP